MQHQRITETRLIRMRQVQALTGLSRSSIYNLASTGKFPQSIPLVPGGTSRAWLESDIQDWIQQRIEAGKQGGQS
jgi:prophage regulatory protein